VYDTLLADNIEAGGHELAELAGADAQAWRAEYARLLLERCTGRLSSAQAAERVMRACGIDPSAELISAVVSAHHQLMTQACPLYDDAVPFLEQLRQRGIKIALVSNCADTTRPFLADLNLLQLADEVILSCEVGFAKPSPEIYLRALSAVGVAAADAVMIDDNPSSCAGAESVGIRAIQIARSDPDGRSVQLAFPIVRSLHDAARLL
jgi:HAD superfamily hydrolase (TIGR01509 family)